MTFQTTLRGLTWAFKWGERPKSGMVYGTNEPVLACSRRSDSAERCKVKGSAKK